MFYDYIYDHLKKMVLFFYDENCDAAVTEDDEDDEHDGDEVLSVVQS